MPAENLWAAIELGVAFSNCLRYSSFRAALAQQEQLFAEVCFALAFAAVEPGIFERHKQILAQSGGGTALHSMAFQFAQIFPLLADADRAASKRWQAVLMAQAESKRMVAAELLARFTFVEDKLDDASRRRLEAPVHQLAARVRGMVCDNCAATGHELLRCGDCQKARYCGRECQKADAT